MRLAGPDPFYRATMTRQHELFGEAVRSRALGPRLPDNAPERQLGIQNTIAWANRLTDEFRRHPHCIRDFPEVITDIVDNPEVNAQVFSYNGTFITALFKGAINTIDYLFRRLLADRAFMPEIGNVENEAPTLPVFRLTANWRDLENNLRNAGHVISDFTPRDPVRREVAGLMGVAAMTFLIAHEFRHLQAGHLHYPMRGGTALPFLEERNDTVLDELSYFGDPTVVMKRQALELDADSAAAYRVFNHLCTYYHQEGRSKPGMRHLTPEQVLSVIYLGCAGLFRILDPYGSPPFGKWETAFYPPNIVRRLIVIAQGQTYIDNCGLASFPPGTSMPNEKLIEILEYNIESIWGCPVDIAYMKQAYHDAPHHIAELRKVQKSMAPEIRKYSYTVFGATEGFSLQSSSATTA
jgi:hypothetical protein